MSRTPQQPKPMSLWRSPGQSARWVLRGLPFRAGVSVLIVLAIALAGWWQRPTITDAYDRVVHSFEPDRPAYQPLNLDPTVDGTTSERIVSTRDDLTRAVGAAGAMIAAKTADKVPTAKLAPTRTAMASAQALLDGDVQVLPPLQTALTTLTTATTTLSKQKAPAVKSSKPKQSSSSSTNSKSSTTSASSSSSGGGTSSSGTKSGADTAESAPRTQTATTSSSLTCHGGTIRATFTATGGGTVTIRVSGPASGSRSGNGSATVVVIGPGGTYSAFASGAGSVAISSVCG